MSVPAVLDRQAQTVALGHPPSDGETKPSSLDIFGRCAEEAVEKAIFAARREAMPGVVNRDDATPILPG